MQKRVMSCLGLTGGCEMDTTCRYLPPDKIEEKSFEIITEELKKTGVIINGDVNVYDLPEDTRKRLLAVIKRCIHATADFDYAKTMWFSDNAASRFDELIRSGATVVTDTNMAAAGISKKALSSHKCKIECYMAEPDVAAEAAQRGVTRAQVSMERAMKLDGPVIFVSGNAPTALMTLREAYDTGEYIPDIVIGVPVGFVNVVRSKEMIMETDIPCIINTGRKGGSSVAAAVVNALLYSMG